MGWRSRVALPLDAVLLVMSSHDLKNPFSFSRLEFPAFCLEEPLALASGLCLRRSRSPTQHHLRHYNCRERQREHGRRHCIDNR